jgi:hypothetical protein
VEIAMRNRGFVTLNRPTFARLGRFFAVSAWLALLFQVTLPAQGGAGRVDAPQAPQKKTKLQQLADPWPDAGTLRERRTKAENLPLFAATDTLALKLSADFRAVNKNRSPDSTTPYPGVLVVTGAAGNGRDIPVTLRVRGHVRRLQRTCDFVPLRVEFEKAEVKDTVFAGQDDLKLVTHCQDSREFDQYVLAEYLAYRIMNAVTPWSFRARLARIAYVDAPSGKTVATRFGVLIEKDTHVARRVEGRVAPLQNRLFRSLDQDSLVMMALFQFLIGNTDYSIIKLHNIRLIQDIQGGLHPITYDFDLAGLVHPPYAAPNPILRTQIATVRDRLYRGPCLTAQQLEPYLARFRAKKAEVLALVTSITEFEPGARQDVLDYVKDFFDVIESRSRTSLALVGRCRAVDGM